MGACRVHIIGAVSSNNKGAVSSFCNFHVEDSLFRFMFLYPESQRDGLIVQRKLDIIGSKKCTIILKCLIYIFDSESWLTPNMPHTTTWTNGDPVQWRIYAS